MTQVTLEDACARLSQLIEDARDGEEIVITRDSAPIAKLVPLDDNAPRPRFGSAKDLILHMADDFAATPEDFDAAPDGHQGAPRSQFGNAKDVLIFMADDFDAPLEDFKEYM